MKSVFSYSIGVLGGFVMVVLTLSWLRFEALARKLPFLVFQLLSHLWLFVTPWMQPPRLPCPSLSPGVCWNSLCRWCHPNISTSVTLFSSFPRNRVFFNELALRIRWPKYWSFSFSITSEWFSPSLNIQSFQWISLDLKMIKKKKKKNPRKSQKSRPSFYWKVFFCTR